jgi:non-specific serine/threonine protein kinase
VGKTRLALFVAEHAPDRLACPLCWVSLADSSNALTDALLTAFELPSIPGQEPLATLRGHVANLDALLVLDSFEHLLLPSASEDVPELFTDLLAHAPLLRCLITSRVPLRIPGEWIYPVAPLEVPPRAALRDGEAGVARYPSVQLFVERARAAEPTWQLLEERMPAVAALCHHLDGLPLAIELAAAQVRAFAVEEILQPWEEAASGRLALLQEGSGGGANATAHPLRRALEASFARLSPAARQSLGDLSVCAGEFSLATAGAIVGADASPVVRELVEASWLQKSEQEGHARYRMLETIRAFGEEFSRTAGSEEAERRHAEQFLRIAQSTAALWDTPRQQEARRTFAGDWPNVQRGFRWACDQGADDRVCAYAALSLAS